MKSLAVVAVLALGVVLPAIAAPAPVRYADPDALDAAVVRFTGVPTGSPGGAAHGVDRRLKLAECRTPLALGWYGARRDTVLLQCPDAPGWRLFVPLLQVEGPSAAPAILRGEAVTITVAGAGFSVSQPGEALENGAPGAWIRVKSAISGTDPLRAQVVRPGLVRVQLGNDLP